MGRPAEHYAGLGGITHLPGACWICFSLAARKCLATLALFPTAYFPRASLNKSLPIFMRYSTSFFASYASQVNPPIPLRSFGGAIAADHVAPQSVLSMTPVPVRTNRWLASVPNTGP